MPRFMMVFWTCLVITVLAGTAVEAAALAKAEKVALKQAIVACKAEATPDIRQSVCRDGAQGTSQRQRGSHARGEPGSDEYSRGAMAGLLGR
jgi:hypothetical protein